MATLNLPTADRRIEAWTTGEPLAFARPEGAFNRVAYSAAHVVADPLADGDPWVTRRSTGTRRSATGTTSGTWGSGSPRRWTRRSAAWDSAGRRRRS